LLGWDVDVAEDGLRYAETQCHSNLPARINESSSTRRGVEGHRFGLERRDSSSFLRLLSKEQQQSMTPSICPIPRSTVVTSNRAKARSFASSDASALLYRRSDLSMSDAATAATERFRFFDTMQSRRRKQIVPKENCCGTAVQQRPQRRCAEQRRRRGRP